MPDNTNRLVNQPDKFRPTNKLTTAVLIAPAVTEAWGAVFESVYPPVSGPEVSMLAGALAALAVGYMVKDRANVK